MRALVRTLECAKQTPKRLHETAGPVHDRVFNRPQRRVPRVAGGARAGKEDEL